MCQPAQRAAHVPRIEEPGGRRGPLAFGKPPQVIFQFFNTTATATGCPADKFAAMDAKKAYGASSRKSYLVFA